MPGERRLKQLFIIGGVAVCAESPSLRTYSLFQHFLTAAQRHNEVRLILFCSHI